MAVTDPMVGGTTDPTKPIKPPAAPNTSPTPTAGAATAPAPAPTSPTPTPLGAVDPMAFAPPPPVTSTTAPTTPAPNAPSWEQGAWAQPLVPPAGGTVMGPTDLMGRPTDGSGKYYASPQFTLGPGGDIGAFQQPDGTWTKKDSSPLDPGTDQYGMSTFTGTGMQPSSTNGVANPNVGKPTVGSPASMTPGSANVNQIPGGSGPAGPGGGVAGLASGAPFTTSPTTPGHDLRSQTITANSGLDRVGLAQKLMENLRAQSEPQWQKTQRDLTQNAAANGQTGSGMFRTSLGDAARQHELDQQNGDLGFLSDALKGSVDDNRFATGVAQQQQQFQEGQQQSAFGQNFATQQLQEALTNGDFSRAIQMLTAGNAGNPADTALALSQIFGNQAGQAGSALGGAIQGREANSQSAAQANIYAQILQQLYGKGAGGYSGGVADPSVYGDG